MTTRTDTDARLLREASRDPAAFVEIYDRHAASVLRFLQGRLASDDDAAELLAETFAQAWLHRRRFRDPGDGGALPWLIGIARNLQRQFWRTSAVDTRARRRLGMPVQHDDEPAVLARLDAGARDKSLREAMGRLPEPAQEIVALRVVDELEYSEIASRLNCSEQTARKRLSLALGQLRREMEVLDGRA